MPAVFREQCQRLTAPQNSITIYKEVEKVQLDYRLSVAPMMAYTDRHFRYLMRLFTKRTLLYTEMVVGTTITYNLKSDLLDRILSLRELEHPIAVQLGGDDVEVLKTAASVCESYGYDEINLNIGCPSDRVQKGRFGACLMKEPGHVAKLVAAMQAQVNIPVTVKHRIGVDDCDSYEDLARFVEVVSQQSQANVFIVHARKAWLKGLSPAQNRSVPPLQYELVHRLKQQFPHLTIIINGGIQDLSMTQEQLKQVDGVMIGRAAYHHPEHFARADELIFGEPAREPPLALDVLKAFDAYAHEQVNRGVRLSFIVKHLVGMFKHQPRARLWRQHITELTQRQPTEFDLTEIYHSVFDQEAPATATC